MPYDLESNVGPASPLAARRRLMSGFSTHELKA